MIKTYTTLEVLFRGARRRLTGLRKAASSLSRWWDEPAGPARRRRSPLGLETLEDRLAPAVYNVTGLADGAGAVTQTSTGVFNATTLRAAITAANANPGGNTINLTVAGDYKITLSGTPGETDNVAGEFAILPSGGNLTITNTSGGNAVIDGQNLNRVFDINPAASNDPATKFLVTFTGFTIENGLAQPGDGAAGSGGGVRDQGNASLTLNNVVVTGNSASADGGGISMENAVGSTAWTLTLNNSTISNNHAGDAGGGVESDGSGHVNINAGTLITGNSAVNQGGGIWLDAITGAIDSVNVTNGGTGYTSAPTVIIGSTDGNGTGATGFATIENEQVVSVTITNSGNGYDAPPKVVFIGGGATMTATATATFVPFQSATLTVTGATISNNYAGGQGGGIGTAGNGAVTITDSTLSGNSTLTSGGGFGDENAADTLTVTNSIFSGNIASTNGGGVSFAGASVSINTSTFRDNISTKGGGVFIDTSTATAQFDRDLFVQNGGVAAEGGGAEFDATSTTLTNSAILDSFAGGNGGGGLFVGGTTFTGTNLTIANNTSSGNGGGIEFDATGIGATESILTNTTITNNSALNNGGGLTGGGIDMSSANAGNLVLINDTINGNFADNGGGLFMGTGTNTLAIPLNTIIAGNTASTGTGPDIDTSGRNVSDLGGNLIGNTSGALGFGGTTQLNVNPLLGPLQYNGGPSVGDAADAVFLQTEAPLFGSPAIGKATVLATLTPNTDERGLLRASFLIGNPDVGAYDTQAIAPQTFSTIPGNGDVNPYGVAFVPANFPTTGVLQPGDLLIANFNNNGNTQGTGTTITRINALGQPSTFFTSTTQMGLDDGLAVLQAGFVVVGNIPNVDGNGTPGQGSLEFLDANGNVVKTLTDANLLNGPWGLTVAKDQGSTVELFVSNALSGTITRINLSITGGVITVTNMTQVASGYTHGPNAAAFVVGPAGLAYDAATDTLYVTAEGDDAVYKISNASTATDNGTGTLVVQDQTHLHGPLGLLLLPNGNLLVANSDGVNADPNQPSELVEYTTTGSFVSQFSVDPNNGGAFGLGLTTANGQIRFAAVDDNANTISVWSNEAANLNDVTVAHSVDPYQFSVNLPLAGSGATSYSATVLSLASVIEQRLGLTYAGSFFPNFLGSNEKWLLSSNGSNALHGGWYLLLPNGDLRAWDGSNSATSGALVGNLGSLWSNPFGLLTATLTQTAAAIEQNLALVYTGSYFTNFLGEGEKWLKSSNGNNATNGGWYLLFPDGDLRAWNGGEVATLNAAFWYDPTQLLTSTLGQTAYATNQSLGLTFTGNLWLNFLGSNEKWLLSDNGSNALHGGWYLLLPNGGLRAWDGSNSATSGALVATLNSTYWQMPGLLYGALPPVSAPAGVSASFLGSSNVLQLAGYHNFIGGFGVQVTGTNGTSTATQDFVVAVTDQAPTLAVADQTVAHTDSLSVTLNGADADPHESLSYSATVISLQTEAYNLTQTLGLTFAGSYFQSSFGINGKWLLSTNGSNAANGGWYFLLSDGTLHAWDGGVTAATATSSPVVATLDASFYNDPMTLLNATPTPPPAGLTSSVSGNVLTLANFGSFTGPLVVVATVSDGLLSGKTSFRVTVT